MRVSELLSSVLAGSPKEAPRYRTPTPPPGPLAGLGGGVGVRYLGASFGDPANTLESSSETLMDALAHYTWMHWDVALNASNLTDKIYVQRCSSLTQCFYGNRRLVTFTAGRKW